MRLLLDEMLSRIVAEQLRARGHDVVGVQEPGCEHLRGIYDCQLLALTAQDRRAVVTDNVPDFVRCHRARAGVDRAHHGLLLFTNDTFPRHRHDQFVSHIIAALEVELSAHPDDDATSWIRWLPRTWT